MTARLRLLTGLVARFGTVGLLAFAVDAGVFNLLRQVAGSGPLTSKTISVVVATTVAYLGNRHWAFGGGRRHGPVREYVLFFVFNAVGLAISLACLGFSTYVLGLHDPLSENVSSNVVGLGLGTLFRLWAYQRWVFGLPVTAAGPDEGVRPRPRRALAATRR